MSELKPCPFCGGVAEVTHMQHRFYTDVEWWWIGCTNDKCPAQSFEGITFDSEQEAIDAWNTRAQTVFGMTLDEVRQMMKRDAERERTCEPKWTLQGETQTQEFWRCECGNCGHEFGVEDRSSFPFKMTIDKVKIPNFCPNCGAKVVE